jgi:PGF-CTERM protein
MVSSSFRYANSLTSIESVTSPVAAGDTVTIEGQTNRNPDDADITIEMLSDTGVSVALDQVSDWDSDGAWSVEIATEGLELGSYVVEADDGDATDRVDVEVVDEVATPTPEPEPEPEPEPTPEPTEEPAEEETPADTPGFGLIVALTALVAAGFLALRRLD